MASSTLDRKEVRDHITMIAEWLTILRANDLLFQLRGYKKSAGQLSSAVPEDAGIFERKLTGIEKKFQQALEFQIDTGTGLKLNKRQAVNLGYKAARSASSAAPAIPMLGTALKLTIGTVQHVEKLLSDLSVYDIPDLIDNQKYPCTCGPDERKSDLTKCDAAIEWIHLRRFTNNAVTYGPASLGLALMVAFPPSSLVAAPAITAMTVSRGLYRKVKEELKKKYDGRPTYLGGQKYVMATHYKVLGEDLPRNKQRAYLVTAGGLDGKEEFFLSPGPNAVWEPDTSATVCSAEGCSTELTSGALYGSNRHHCRVCGEIFCDDCSSAKLPVLDSLSTYSPVFFGKARGQNVARGEVTVTIDATHTRGRMAFIHEQARVCANCFGLACQFAAKTHLVTNGPMRRAEHLIEAAIPKTGSSQGCLRALATIFTISRGNRRNTLLTVLAVDGAKTLVNAAEIKS